MTMKLIGDLKKKVEESTSREAAKAAIEDAGMELTDEELEKVAGGYGKQKVMADCYYCGSKHDLICYTGLKVKPWGLTQKMDATRYICPTTARTFYIIQRPDGGTAMADEQLRIVG